MSTPPPPPPPPPSPGGQPEPYEGQPPPQPTYPPPGQGYAPEPPSGGNGMATGSLVCGIIAVIFGTILGFFVLTIPIAILLGIVAIVLGVIGLNRAKVSGTGRGQAIGGLVTGGIGLVAALLWIALGVAAISAFENNFGELIEDPEAFEQQMEEQFDQLEDVEEGG